MSPDLTRRALVLVAVITVIGLPAAVLRGLCVGRSCDEGADAQASVPFCSLPGNVRSLIATSEREGRSPDVLVVTRRPSVRGGTDLRSVGQFPLWPSLQDFDEGRVPLAFWGDRVEAGSTIPGAPRLDVIAPTLAHILELRRPHPEVRTGEALDLVSDGQPPRLVLEIILRTADSELLEANSGKLPFVDSLMSDGASTMNARAGSIPLDATTVLTTISTGGTPHQHGITGTLVRNDTGKLVHAWGPGAPVSVIAGLGDDLDELLHQDPRVGLVAAYPTDRGIIGGNWYVDTDTDDIVVEPNPRAQASAAEDLLKSGYGADDVPDLMAVVLQGADATVDASIRRIVEAAGRASNDSLTVVVTATGSGRARPAGVIDFASVQADLESRVSSSEDVVEAVAPGGVWLDQATLARQKISENEILEALKTMTGPDGSKLFADEFSAIAVSFARYC